MKKLLYFFAFTFCIAGLQAQESIITSGGEATGSGGSVSLSVGQTVYNTHTGATGSIAEGVQQPYEISIVIGIEETGINLRISAYPNPTSDHLILKIDDNTSVDKKWLATLYDINGAEIMQQIIVANETTINMTSLKAATYFLQVKSENQAFKTFKIIKLQ